MSIAIRPKLLRHLDGRLYAYRGYNQIAMRFGGQIRVALVRRLGPFFFLGHDFFERMDGYQPAPNG
jgi:hypothetical protein